jgi:membrane dipeptidase
LPIAAEREGLTSAFCIRADGHNDLAIVLRHLYGNHIYDKNFTEPFEDGGLYGHVDLPRLKKGKVGGVFWSAYTSCPKDGDDFSDGNYAGGIFHFSSIRTNELT